MVNKRKTTIGVSFVGKAKTTRHIKMGYLKTIPFYLRLVLALIKDDVTKPADAGKFLSKPMLSSRHVF